MRTVEGPGTIAFAEGATVAIQLLSGQLNITEALTIDGSGAEALSINGGGASRVFLLSSADLSLRGVTVADGCANDFQLRGLPEQPALATAVALGVALAVGGAILNEAGSTLEVQGSSFMQNSTTSVIGENPIDEGLLDSGRCPILLMTLSGACVGTNWLRARRRHLPVKQEFRLTRNADFGGHRALPVQSSGAAWPRIVSLDDER